MTLFGSWCTWWGWQPLVAGLRPLHSAAGLRDLAGEYREGMVLTAAYREFLSAIATSAGALTGLLFVAISAAPRRRHRGSDASPAVIQQVRAAAALVAFFNALAVSIFGLVPGGSVRYPAVVLGIGGILFTAAGMRSVLSSQSTTRQRLVSGSGSYGWSSCCC